MSIVVVFDLETGGLDPATHVIIQIAALAVELPSYKVIASFCEKVKFNIAKQDPDALAGNVFGRNGYTAETWNAEAKNPVTVANMFQAWLRPYKERQEVSKAGKPYLSVQLAGHNVYGFDLPFISKWMKRLKEAENAAGREFSDYLPFNWQPLDTLAIASFYRYMMPGYDPLNLKLETLCRYHGIAESQSHDGLDDCRLTAALLCALQNGFKLDNATSANAPQASDAIQDMLLSLPPEMRAKDYE
jgi:DNA polymerase III epsilon subunit-like protein